MAIATRSLAGQTAWRSAWTAGVRVPGAVVAKTVSALRQLVAGSGGGYRNYPRERFSDYELYQLVTGRKGRLDGPF